MATKIEWTEDTWNPLIGCDKVSAGCKNCYAIQTAWIRSHNPAMKEKYAGTVEKTAAGKLNWTGQINMHEPSLQKPLKEKKPTVYFVNSMSDLFHKDVPFSFIDKVFAVMALTPQHTYQILTKRADRMAEYFKSRDEDMKEICEEAEIMVCETPHLFHVVEQLKGRAKQEIGNHHITNEILPHLKQAGWYWDTHYSEFGKENHLIFEGEWPLKNVWLGVSVEDQKAADERVPFLLQVPTAVRFLSCEPLLGSVEITGFKYHYGSIGPVCKSCSGNGYYSDNFKTPCPDCDHTGKTPWAIHWVICGGESGPNARPMHPDWARELKDQCEDAGIPFFFKQWGNWLPWEHDAQPPFYNSQNGQTIDGHALPDVFDHPKWDDGLWTVAEDLGPCMFENVGKKKAGRMLDGRIHDGYPALS